MKISLNHTKKKVAFLTIFENGIAPNQRYRIEAFTKSNPGFDYKYFPVLFKKEVKVYYGKSIILKLLIAAKIVFRRAAHMFSLSKYGTVFIARESIPFGSAVFEIFIKKILKKRIVYDFDDAIWIKKMSVANRRLSFLKSTEKFAKIMSLADVVIAGNTYLAAYALQHNKNTIVIPSSVDMEIYREKKSVPHNKICIGWSGSESTLDNFLKLIPVLLYVQKKYSNAVFFKVISSQKDLNINGLDLKSVKWSEENEISDLSEIDIGIMPLPDDEWSKGKCSMKGIQYMGLGITTVMSAIGTNNEVIQNGVNGFLAVTEEEWEICLGKLIEDSALREQLGKQGRKTIEEKYSIQHWITTWKKAVTGETEIKH